MDYTTLGKTGLKVSVAGLGMGGNSRLGQNTGRTEDESIRIVKLAMDMGVNFFDTAKVYGTEPILGKALQGADRDSLVVATKATIWHGDEPKKGDAIIRDLEESLKTLRMDYVDLFQLHAVTPERYDQIMKDIGPSLQQAKRDGKIRHIGISETAPMDPTHAMLERAVNEARADVHREPFWETAMMAFHMMGQNARRKILPDALKNGVGTLLMFVVRNIFSQPDYLRATMNTLAAEGKVPLALAENENPLGFLVHEGGATSVIDAAYRFARHEKGADVILFGTGNDDHLKANIQSIVSPPLPAQDVQKLYDLFGHLEGVGLDHSVTASGGGRRVPLNK